MLHKLLVTATDLEHWADLLEGKSTFPELLRRLIITSASQLSHVSFASAEGVQLGGWDGLSTAGQSTAFVPLGTTGWELGTNQDRKGKADGDYDKRTTDPLGLVKTDSAFIFCTPRRWGSKDAWTTGRRAEGHWRDVRVYDADDLTTWLATAPVVHIWLSRLLGKQPSGVADLESFWRDWAGVITPPVPDALLLAGRTDTTERLHGWLLNPSSTFPLVADSRKEAVAILASAVLSLPERERLGIMARAVVVESPSAWQELTATTQSLLLIPLFRDNEAIASAVRQGHQVFVALDHTDVVSDAHAPSRLGREAAASVLRAGGFASGQVDILAGVARRSMAAFRRHRLLHPIGPTAPDWVTMTHAPVLLAAALVGAWNENEREAAADKEAIAELASSPYEQVRAELMHLANSSEPPVRLVGTIWYVVDKADVWTLMARFLSPTMLDRFTTVVQRILGTPLPRYELPVDQQLWADLYGKRAPTSQLLRRQVADTLAFLGADESAPPYVSSLATSTVRALLMQANNQPNMWLSLANFLPRLAEASPDDFLDGVSVGLSGGTTPIMVLFEERPALFHTTASHPGLLWALELLAWHPPYMGYAARLLANLSQRDPGGNLANRPARSLAAIFLPWFPQTRATAAERLAVLDGLRNAYPEVTWSLLLSLLPNTITHIGDTHKPAWRDWVPANLLRGTNWAHYHADIEAMTERVVQDVGTDPNRWAALVPEIPDLPPHHLPDALQQLHQLATVALLDAQRDKLVHALRELVHHQRSLEQDDHKLSPETIGELEEIYNALQPDDYLRRYAWIFGAWPRLLSGERYRKERGMEEYREKIVQTQRETLNSLLLDVGLRGVLAMITHVEVPSKLGELLGERADISSEQKDELLTRYLGSADGTERQFGHGLALGYRLTQPDPWEWATVQVRRYQRVWSPAQQAAWLDTFPTNPTTWQLAAELGPATEQQHWEQISPYWVEKADVTLAFGYFLQHGRPLAALHLARLHERVVLPTAVLTDALEAVLYAEAADEPNVRMDSHDFVRLLDRLADAADVDEVRIAKLEFDLLPAQHERRLSAKALYRALCASPDFFAQMVQMCSPSDDGSDPPSAEDNRRFNVYKLLHGWSILPGQSVDNSIDSKCLSSWVQASCQAVAAIGRTRCGEELIGEMFSASPTGSDGLWPHEAVRDAVEVAASVNIERGFRVGTANNRSFTVRSAYDGGTQEWGVAAIFTSDATAMALQWPRTAGVLRRLAASYQYDAKREDDEANLDHDLGL